MTSYQELDILHNKAAHMAVQLAMEIMWEVNGRARS